MLMAPALLLLLVLANDREIMGGLANGRLANIAGGTIVVLIAAIGAAYGVITAFPGLIGK
jgi:Mn2+/Fe2+ NRAMP family transporter